MKKDEKDYKGKSNLKQKIEKPINNLVNQTIYDSMFK